MLLKKAIKKQKITVEIENKILLLVLGMENGGSYSTPEIAQIVSLSTKNIKLMLFDDNIVTKEDCKYDKFLESDIGRRKDDCVASRCACSFSLNIDTLNRLDSYEDILSILNNYRGYFPIIINNKNEFKIKEAIIKSLEYIGNAIYLDTVIDSHVTDINLYYKKDGKYIIPESTESIDALALMEVSNMKSTEKMKNLNMGITTFLYIDDIITGRDILTSSTRFLLEQKQALSKYIGAGYTKEKQFKNSKFVKPNIGDKILIMVVGLGGTGASVSYDVCHKVSNIKDKDIKIVFIDGDVVESKNLIRQRFVSNDINKYKSEATAAKCRKAYNIEILECNDFIDDEHNYIYEAMREYEGYYPIILGCSDSLKLREYIGNLVLDMPKISDLPNSVSYIDGGNDTDSGQVIFTCIEDGKIVTPEFFMEFPHAKEQAATALLVTHIPCGQIMESAPQTKGANLSSARAIYSYVDDILEGKRIYTYLTHFNNVNKAYSSKFIQDANL